MLAQCNPFEKVDEQGRSTLYLDLLANGTAALEDAVLRYCTPGGDLQGTAFFKTLFEFREADISKIAQAIQAMLAKEDCSATFIHHGNPLQHFPVERLKMKEGERRPDFDLEPIFSVLCTRPDLYSADNVLFPLFDKLPQSRTVDIRIRTAIYQQYMKAFLRSLRSLDATYLPAYKESLRQVLNIEIDRVGLVANINLLSLFPREHLKMKDDETTADFDLSPVFEVINTKPERYPANVVLFPLFNLYEGGSAERAFRYALLRQYLNTLPKIVLTPGLIEVNLRVDDMFYMLYADVRDQSKDGETKLINYMTIHPYAFTRMNRHNLKLMAQEKPGRLRSHHFAGNEINPISWLCSFCSDETFNRFVAEVLPEKLNDLHPLLTEDFFPRYYAGASNVSYKKILERSMRLHQALPEYYTFRRPTPSESTIREQSATLWASFRHLTVALKEKTASALAEWVEFSKAVERTDLVINAINTSPLFLIMMKNPMSFSLDQIDCIKKNFDSCLPTMPFAKQYFLHHLARYSSISTSQSYYHRSWFYRLPKQFGPLLSQKDRYDFTSGEFSLQIKCDAPISDTIHPDLVLMRMEQHLLKVINAKLNPVTMYPLYEAVDLFINHYVKEYTRTYLNDYLEQKREEACRKAEAMNQPVPLIGQQEQCRETLLLLTSLFSHLQSRTHQSFYNHFPLSKFNELIKSSFPEDLSVILNPGEDFYILSKLALASILHLVYYQNEQVKGNPDAQSQIREICLNMGGVILKQLSDLIGTTHPTVQPRNFRSQIAAIETALDASEKPKPSAKRKSNRSTALTKQLRSLIAEFDRSITEPGSGADQASGSDPSSELNLGACYQRLASLPCKDQRSPEEENLFTAAHAQIIKLTKDTMQDETPVTADESSDLPLTKKAKMTRQ
ncbi:MAG: hypothetical protein CMF48_07570 [Legionellales bacterium]|nr:hypothetical protein [Legionellales bacterium]